MPRLLEGDNFRPAKKKSVKSFMRGSRNAPLVRSHATFSALMEDSDRKWKINRQPHHGLVGGLFASAFLPCSVFPRAPRQVLRQPLAPSLRTPLLVFTLVWLSAPRFASSYPDDTNIPAESETLHVEAGGSQGRQDVATCCATASHPPSRA